MFLALALSISAALTYWLIQSGIDWNWAVFFNEHPVFVWMSTPFVLAGMVVPLFPIGFFYFRYRKHPLPKNKLHYQRTLWSFVLTYTVMTLLKIFTNRVDMEPFFPIGTVDFSDQFRFGFLNSNSWWESFSEGWPSGHTLIAVGMAIAMHPLLKSKIARGLNIAYPILIALSVSTAFHWLSDVVSGALLGWLIGYFIKKKYTVS